MDRVWCHADPVLSACRNKLTGDCPAIPPPLVDSPKCPRCSLLGICLPDEVIALSRVKLNNIDN